MIVDLFIKLTREDFASKNNLNPPILSEVFGQSLFRIPDNLVQYDLLSKSNYYASSIVFTCLLTEYDQYYQEPIEKTFIKLERQHKEKEVVINEGKNRVKFFQGRFDDSYDDENLIKLLLLYNRQKLKVFRFLTQENASKVLCQLERLFVQEINLEVC